MSKNIVVCSDGTGNTAIKDRGTNVFKVFEAVDLTSHQTDSLCVRQVAIYDDGVGTQDFLPARIIGGAFGWGLSKNIRRLHLEIARIYEPGDRLFFFGFSRGAFTVRVLAGLIQDMGLLDLKKPEFQNSEFMHECTYKVNDIHRRRYPSVLQRLFGGSCSDTQAQEFRQKYCLPNDIPIEFIGVWDTVNAVGAPSEEFRYLLNAIVFRATLPDNKILHSVRHAYHALSVDDERQTFHPTMWEPDPKVEQVWFPGVHANVGGGYPKQGMSLVALDWMLSKAERHGLRFLPEVRHLYKVLQSEADTLYDSRAGVAVYYRYAPRNVGQLCQSKPPKLHVSVLRRIAQGTDGYAPGNLPTNCEIVFTDPQDRAAANADAIRNVLKTAGDENGIGSLISVCCKSTFWRKRGYDGFVLFTVLSVVRSLPIGKPASEWWAMFREISWGSMALELLVTLCREPWLLVGLIVSYFVSYCAHGKQQKLMATFWHALRPELSKLVEPPPTPFPLPPSQQL